VVLVDSSAPAHLALRAALGSLPRAAPGSGGVGILEYWPRWGHTLFPNNHALVSVDALAPARLALWAADGSRPRVIPNSSAVVVRCGWKS